MQLGKFKRWWITPQLPKQHWPRHVADVKKWVVHPIKRRIARFYLRVLKRLFRIKVIAITGSAGKTTTKEMLASTLSLCGETVYSKENIDPVYNIPSTILRCRPSTKYLVLEMGVEFPHEMDFYCWLARPDVGVLTNIYPTHTEFFGSIEGVLREKTKLIEHIDRNGLIILNNNDRRLANLKNKLRNRNVFWYGKGTDVKYVDEKITADMKTKYTLCVGRDKLRIILPVGGIQFVYNSLAAVSAGIACGASLTQIKFGLENFSVPEHRMRLLRLNNGAIVVDDSYNNNPKAAEETLRTFKNLYSTKEKIVVFGDMLELGKLKNEYHKELGKLISTMTISNLICVGKESRLTLREFKRKSGRVGYYAENWQQALKLLKPLLKRNTVTLIKGSRSVGLDNLVSQLS